MPNRNVLTQPRSQLLYAYPLQVLQDNPLQYYRCSDAVGSVALDQTPGKYNGTYHTTVDTTFGQASIFTRDPSTAVKFLNSAGYITLPLLTTQLANITLECILKVPDNLQFGYAMKVGDTPTGYGLGVGGANVRVAGLQLCGEQDNIADIPSTYSLVAGVWTYVCMTLSATTALFYAGPNGALVGTVAVGTSIVPTGKSYLGTSTKASSLVASLSDAAFYDYILSPTQIASHAVLAQ